jgi:hypothetical protein
VPAAAVIPALKMHRIIAAVKKLVVGSLPAGESPLAGRYSSPSASWLGVVVGVVRARLPLLGRVYFEQIRVLSTGVSPGCSCME